MEDSSILSISLNQSKYQIGDIEQKIKRLTVGELKKSSIKKKKDTLTDIISYQDFLLNHNQLDQFINEIEQDSNYSRYLMKKDKAEQVNKANFLSRQPQIVLEPDTPLNKTKKGKTYSNSSSNITKEQWLQMKNELAYRRNKRKQLDMDNIERSSIGKDNKEGNSNGIGNGNKVNDDEDDDTKAIEFENDYSSDDSYDSDLNPFTQIKHSIIKKRISDIKKSRHSHKEDIYNDMKRIYNLYKVISD